jgi:hypothetical protein
MPVTDNTAITWEESNKLGWSFGNDTTPAEATRYAQVNNADVNEFIKAVLGWSALRGGGGVTRVLPERHPRWPWLYATAVSFVRETGEAADTGPLVSLEFGSQELLVTYREKSYAVLPDEAKPVVKVATETWRYTTRTRTLAVHGQIIPRNVLEFVPVAAEAPELVPEPGSEFLSSASIKMLWWEIPCVERDGTPELPAGLRNNIDNSLACVNTDLFDDRYPRGTLLMLAPEEAYRRMSNGLWCCDVTFHFEQRGAADNWDDVLSEFPSWRHVRRGSGKFQRVRRKDDPTKEIYGHFAFKDLFWPF